MKASVTLTLVPLVLLLGCGDQDNPASSDRDNEGSIVGVWSNQVEAGLKQFYEYRPDGTYVFNYERDGTAWYGISGRYTVDGDHLTQTSQLQFSWLDGAWVVAGNEAVIEATYALSADTLRLSAPGLDPEWTRVTGKALFVPEGA